MTSAKISDFLPPTPVRKFTQPPLLRLLTMSAFEGTPSPPPFSADVINGSPLTRMGVALGHVESARKRECSLGRARRRRRGAQNTG